MRGHKIIVNSFEVERGPGYPYWITIRYRGEEIARIDHREIKDLEYALSRTRDELRAAMDEKEKHEA